MSISCGRFSKCYTVPTMAFLVPDLSEDKVINAEESSLSSPRARFTNAPAGNDVSFLLSVDMEGR